MEAEIIKALAVWPITVPFGLVICAVIFRGPLAAKIQQLLHLKGKDFEAGFGQAEEQTLKKSSEPPKDALPPPSSAAASPPEQNAVYSAIEADARKRLDQALGHDVALQRDWAIRMFATSQVEKGHEIAYRMIFGSQIRALQTLNERGAVDIAEGIQGFNEAVAADPAFYADTNYTFEMWANFLIRAGYVETTSANIVPGTKAVITPMGRDFLVWMAARGVPSAKRG